MWLLEVPPSREVSEDSSRGVASFILLICVQVAGVIHYEAALSQLQLVEGCQVTRTQMRSRNAAAFRLPSIK